MSWTCEKCNNEYKDSDGLRKHQSENHPDLYQKKTKTGKSIQSYSQNLLDQYKRNTPDQ